MASKAGSRATATHALDEDLEDEHRAIALQHCTRSAEHVELGPVGIDLDQSDRRHVEIGDDLVKRDHPDVRGDAFGELRVDGGQDADADTPRAKGLRARRSAERGLDDTDVTNVVGGRLLGDPAACKRRRIHRDDAAIGSGEPAHQHGEHAAVRANVHGRATWGQRALQGSNDLRLVGTPEVDAGLGRIVWIHEQPDVVRTGRSHRSPASSAPQARDDESARPPHGNRSPQRDVGPHDSRAATCSSSSQIRAGWLRIVLASDHTSRG